MKNVDLTKVTLNLRQGDKEYLETMCRPRGIAVSFFIRNLIAKKVDELRRNEPRPQIEGLEL